MPRRCSLRRRGIAMMLAKSMMMVQFPRLTMLRQQSIVKQYRERQRIYGCAEFNLLFF